MLPDLLQLMLGILFGAAVLRPDAIIASENEIEWPYDVPYDPVAFKRSNVQMHTRKRTEKEMSQVDNKNTCRHGRKNAIVHGSLARAWSTGCYTPDFFQSTQFC